MKKKVVWLPYDMDTAIGINNEGSLVFSYNLEDTDQVGNSDVYNGQDSVFWNNLRLTYADELKEMYQTLRTARDTLWAYDKIEERFEEHQSKWPEAVFNEDAWFKYLQPLVDDNDGGYLGMLQGSKAEQRKWWLYNRFRYLDSKYNTGDAKSDLIFLRGYAIANISVTPYADIYATVKWGSYILQQRAARNETHVFVCPLDNVNDTETEIYSASQIASVGDLSGYQVGEANFASAIKLQDIKIGDASSSYQNTHFTKLLLGNNTLLKTIDCRNCVNLGTSTVAGSTPAPDLSGCTGLEEAYFEGTQITGIQFANGGFLKTVHLPATVLSLQIFNQPHLTDLSIPSYTQLRNVALVNVGNTVDEISIINQLANGTHVRFIGFSWQLSNVAALNTLKAKLDMLGGLNEDGTTTMDMAQLQGNIYVPTLTGAAVAEFQASYPSVTFSYDHITAELKYYSWDGQTLLHTETVTDGGNGTYTGTPSRTQTAQYTFAFSGWSTEMDSGTADANALKNVESDRNVYAAYTKTVRTYTVRFMNGSTVLQTVNNVPYGGTATYTGSTPVHSDPDNYEFNGWNPSPVGITGATDCQPSWNFIGSLVREFVTRSYKSREINLGSIGQIRSYAFDSNTRVTSVVGLSVLDIGVHAFDGCTSLTTVSFPNVKTVGMFGFNNCRSLSSVAFPELLSVGKSVFANCSQLQSVDVPKLMTLDNYAFASCYLLKQISLYVASSINLNVFQGCRSLESVYCLAESVCGLGTGAFAMTPMSLSSYLGYFGSIYVPSSLVSAYKSATNWTLYADRITAYEGE